MVTLPTVHLNGTSGAELLTINRAAYDAILAATAALGRAAPNARDYYPQGPYAYREANAEHMTRLVLLDKIREELEEITRHCFASGRRVV